MPYKTTWKDRLENAEPFLGPIIAGTLILALVGWLAWHTYGPAKTAKPLGRTPQDEAARSAAVQRVASEADVLEKTYRRALEAGAAPDATARMLNRAIEKQTELLRLGSSSSRVQTEKLAVLEAERATQRARSALGRSKLLEAESLAAQQAGLNVEAREKMREALRLQQEANANAAAPALRDAPRESRLAQEIEAADAGPLVAGVASGLTLARSAVARENWDEALKNFSEARKGQEEINRRFPGSRFADVKALEKIDGEIESVQAGSLVVATQAREREAETATKAGRAQEAGASLAAAAAAQRELNVKFPRSRFASTTRLEELEARRQTVLSEVKLGRAIAIERDIGAALRRRQNVAAAEKLAEAAKLVETVATDFPLSRALNPTLQRKLAYLAMRAGELDTLQEQVLGRLAAVPGTVGLQMLKTEVPQEFYERVMNLNPSRNVGRGLPVDSVSWVDAQEFCVRVSWLLGLRVRLPSEPEFAACWSGAGAGVWSAENSEGRSQESGKRTVSRMGFHDLAGNLAEWLQPANEAGELAPVAGGSYLDASAALQNLKIVQTEKRERARHIGLRVVVETGAN